MDQPDMTDIVKDPLVEEIIISESGETCPSDIYLAGDRRTWSEIRANHEDAYLSDKPIARCAACHQPVKPRMSKDSKRFFWHFHKNAQCPYQGKSGPSQRILDAMRYNGQKEGDKHKRVKQLLVDSLSADNSFDQESLNVEKRWWGITDEKKWRTPDVSILHSGVRIAFEVQLSTTYLSVMRERHKFYLENGGLLFWIFREAQTLNPRQMQDDIFYWNNSNLFVVDEESRRLSRDRGELMLRCHYLVPQLDGPEVWQERFIKFSELTIDFKTQRAYWFDNYSARMEIEEKRKNQKRANLREHFLDLWKRSKYGTTEEFKAEYSRLAVEFISDGITLPLEPNDNIKRFVWLCQSALEGTGVGFKYDTLLQVANYAFDNCPELVHYFLATAKRAGTTQLLVEQDESAMAKRQRLGKPRESWVERIKGFRESYQLAKSQQQGKYPIDRQFDDLFKILFLSP